MALVIYLAISSANTHNPKNLTIGHIELLLDLGKDIPSASNLSKLLEDNAFTGYTWALVDMDIVRLLGGSEKINVTLPKSLIYRCVATHPEYKSRSGFLAQVASDSHSLAIKKLINTR